MDAGLGQGAAAGLLRGERVCGGVLGHCGAAARRGGVAAAAVARQRALRGRVRLRQARRWLICLLSSACCMHPAEAATLSSVDEPSMQSPAACCHCKKPVEVCEGVKGTMYMIGVAVPLAER